MVMIAKKPLHIQSATNRIQLSSTNGEHFQPRFHFHKVNYNAYYDCAGIVTFTRVFGAFSLCTKYFHRCLSDDLLIFNQKSLNIVNLRHIVIYCSWQIWEKKTRVIENLVIISDVNGVKQKISEIDFVRKNCFDCLLRIYVIWKIKNILFATFINFKWAFYNW